MRLVEAAADTTRKTADRQPLDYTPRHLADRILTMRSSLEGERKHVTVFFADVVHSMSLAESLGAETWHTLLDRFFRILCEPIHRMGGTINQFTGDGVMALFGAPIAHEDHARRACHAALEIAEALSGYHDALLRERGIDFRARMGLNSGEVVVGKIGDDLRMDYTAQGHAVGLAARVERLAQPGSIYLTASTAELVEGYFDLHALGPQNLVGTRSPVAVFELRGTGSMRTRLDVASERGFSPFVGRDEKLRSLTHALAQATDGGGLVLGVDGPAGVGKSRLAVEFAAYCAKRGVPVYPAHCPSHGQAVPLLPIQELLRSYFGCLEPETAEITAKRVRADPIFDRADLANTLPDALELLGVDGGMAIARRDQANGHAGARHDPIADLLCGLVQLRGSHEPSVVLVDDLHWIDEHSERILAQLVAAIPETKTLLLLNFRSDYRADWMSASHYRQLGLAALSAGPRDELVAALLGDDPSLERLRERIHVETAGNPLFIEELIRSLADTGRLTGAPGSYCWVDGPTPLHVPATLQPILAARIDRLPEPDKHILQMAAVVGRQFERATLERIAQPFEGTVAESIERLEAAQFIYCRSLHPNAPWVFHHALVRDVAYQSVLLERRQRLHAAVARAIEEQADALGQRAALIAYHWEAADESRLAARWRLRADLRVTHIQPRRRS